MEHIATFYTHLGALRFHRKGAARGDEADMMPVPRRLSASCGTCVKFSGEFTPELAVEDLEAVYLREGEGYREVFRAEE